MRTLRELTFQLAIFIFEVYRLRVASSDHGYQVVIPAKGGDRVPLSIACKRKTLSPSASYFSLQAPKEK